jgi:hypothetical protein
MGMGALRVLICDSSIFSELLYLLMLLLLLVVMVVMVFFG